MRGNYCFANITSNCSCTLLTDHIVPHSSRRGGDAPLEIIWWGGDAPLWIIFRLPRGSFAGRGEELVVAVCTHTPIPANTVAPGVEGVLDLLRFLLMQSRTEFHYTHTCYIVTTVQSCSVGPRKLCVGLKYYIVCMYSVPYYTYCSTANFLFLEPTALTYIYQKNGAVTRIYVVLETIKLNE